MPTRFIGGVLSAKPQKSSQFVSRASTGTYFDSTGVLRTAPVNQPRLNYEFVGGAWTGPQVLIEPASTNQCVYSIPSVWSAFQSTATANSTTAPDGTSTATLLTEDSTSSSFHVLYTSGGNTMTPSAGVYTCSIFAKAGTRNNAFLQWGGDGASTRIAVNFNLTTGVAQSYITQGTPTQYGWTSTPVGNGWWRLSVYAYQTTNTLYIVVGTAISDAATQVPSSTAYYTGGTGGTVYFWGAQQELGRTTTSYIPTTGTIATRSEDRVGPQTSGIYDIQDLYQNSEANNYRVESFTTTGETWWTCPQGVSQVEALVVAGGGGGGADRGGGGGAGGLIYNPSYSVVAGKTYKIAVGAGGAGGLGAASGYLQGSNGNNSQFDNIIAIGGGGGGTGNGTTGASALHTGKSGGSGGGAVPASNGAYYGGYGIPQQGNPGGSSTVASSQYPGTGGGGAGGPGVGFGSSSPGLSGAAGGPGLYFTITGSSVAYAGGGGGGPQGSSYTPAPGGVGGGGTGQDSPTAGTPNTGGGGGGSGNTSGNVGGGTLSGANGGSGIVILRYRRENIQQTATNNRATVVQRFTQTGSNYTWTCPQGVTSVEALVVAGGGGGGYGTSGRSGGGGAGGVVYNSAYAVTPGSSYTITAGNGGSGSTTNAQLASVCNGSNSVFGTLIALGGGGGGNASTDTSANLLGANGGSGGGGGASATVTNNYAGGTATQSGSGSGGFGNTGGTGVHLYGTWAGGGSGGGAGSAGNIALNISGYAPPGGTGIAFSIVGTPEYYAGGGGGSYYTGTVQGPGGIGGGGSGNSTGVGYSGASNTGGGGGAGGNGAGGAGGSGVVVLKYQVPNIAIFIESGFWTCPAGVYSVQALIVAGGGAGGGGGSSTSGGAGGGAGGLLYSTSINVVPGQVYSVIVGQGGSIGSGGGTSYASDGGDGANSSFAGLVAIGGGGGRAAEINYPTGINGRPGGSGGGATRTTGTNLGGLAVYGQGNNGGAGADGWAGAGSGGGAGGSGNIGGTGSTSSVSPSGGIGLQFSISGSPTYYAGGGGSGNYGNGGTPGQGGLGGGGAGNTSSNAGVSGTANTGGGGGGGGGQGSSVGGRGGSGIVIIRWN